MGSWKRIEPATAPLQAEFSNPYTITPLMRMIPDEKTSKTNFPKEMQTKYFFFQIFLKWRRSFLKI